MYISPARLLGVTFLMASVLAVALAAGARSTPAALAEPETRIVILSGYAFDITSPTLCALVSDGNAIPIADATVDWELIGPGLLTDVTGTTSAEGRACTSYEVVGALTEGFQITAFTTVSGVFDSDTIEFVAPADVTFTRTSNGCYNDGEYGQVCGTSREDHVAKVTVARLNITGSTGYEPWVVVAQGNTTTSSSRSNNGCTTTIDTTGTIMSAHSRLGTSDTGLIYLEMVLNGTFSSPCENNSQPWSSGWAARMPVEVLRDAGNRPTAIDFSSSFVEQGPIPAQNTGTGFLPFTRRPVVIVPGIGGTYAANVSNDETWLKNRGIAPNQLQIDPLAKTYHDMIKTFENLGYVQGKDLFLANYDWRLMPGPNDGAIDGEISDLTGSSLTDSTYQYGVDYLGYTLKEAVEAFAADNPGHPPLSKVDVIAHSTGGLVTRAYIQSDAYGDTYSGDARLPKIEHFIMVATPNRGAPKAFNPYHDNWITDGELRMVMSRIVNRAFQKVSLFGQTITGSDHDITPLSIGPANCAEGPYVCFVRQYVPSIRALFPTDNFLLNEGSNVATDVNLRPTYTNSFLLDLNNGLDFQLQGDKNAFADRTDVTAIYGTNGGQTTFFVQELRGPTLYPPGLLPIAPFVDLTARNAAFDEIFYRDLRDSSNNNGAQTTESALLASFQGDGTVPAVSAIGQFLGDARVRTVAFIEGGNTSSSVGHGPLMSNPDVQAEILEEIGIIADASDISTGSGGAGLGSLACAVQGCLTFVLDPVDGYVQDAQGRRLGYTAATGPMAEIPNSMWFGASDGIGWVFGPVEGPLTLHLNGLGGQYYVMVSELTEAGIDGGVVAQGSLGAGESAVVPVPPAGSADPTPTATTELTATPTLTDTATPLATDTPTATPTIEDAATPTPTDTPTHTATPTDTPTHTATPTDTPTHTATPTDTPTHTATPTDTPTHTAPPTDTPTPTATATNASAQTNTPTPTSQATATRTATPAAGHKCADVTGNGVVTFHDVLAIVFRIGQREGTRGYDARYDLDHDQRIKLEDAGIALLQLGRRCRQA